MGSKWFPILENYPFQTQSDKFVNIDTGAILSVIAVKEHCDSKFYGRVVVDIGGTRHVLWADNEGHRRKSLTDDKEMEAARKDALVKATAKMLYIISELDE